MILIIRQVTKVNFKYTWLIPFLTGMVLTSCNSYLKQEETRVVPPKPNDTVFLTQAFGYSKIGQEAADMAKLKAKDQKIRIYAEKLALLQQKSEHDWDSLSRKKNIIVNDKLSKNQRNQVDDLRQIKAGKFDREFLIKMEDILADHINFLENVSSASEDNEITTLAIKLLPEYNNQLDTLISIRKKIIE